VRGGGDDRSDKGDSISAPWCPSSRREGLLNLHFAPNIIRAMELKRMRWAGHVAHRGGENAYNHENNGTKIK
jgi:hypothetical protein